MHFIINRLINFIFTEKVINHFKFGEQELDEEMSVLSCDLGNELLFHVQTKYLFWEFILRL